MTSVNTLLTRFTDIDPISEMMFGMGLLVASLMWMAILIGVDDMSSLNKTYVILIPVFISGGIMLDATRRS